MKPESVILAETKLMAGLIPGLRLMRNNNGTAMINGRRVQFGLGKGTPDLFGFYSIVIRPEHVGKRIAVATGVECKTEVGVLSVEQSRFLNLLNSFGGICLALTRPDRLKDLIASHEFPNA